jgi:hypothetical protein
VLLGCAGPHSVSWGISSEGRAGLCFVKRSFAAHQLNRLKGVVGWLSVRWGLREVLWGYVETGIEMWVAFEGR